MLDECPNCRTILVVDASDAELIDRALSVLTSDYNDVDHEAIAALRDRIRKALTPTHEAPRD